MERTGRRGGTTNCAFRVLAFSCALFAATPDTSAQPPETSTFLYQQRILEEQLRPLIEPELRSPAAEDRFQYDYGGVLRSLGLWFEDDGPKGLGAEEFQGSRAVFDWDFRPWLSASLDGVHFAFIRGQFDFLQYHSGDSYTRNSDWRGPFVDVGFYRLDVDEAARRYWCEEVEHWSTDVTVGRQFLYVGRGVAFALITDAVSVDWSCGDWAGLVFGSQSVRHYDNIDRSVPGFRRNDREFFGAQLEYEAFDHHKPYGYVVVQRDRSDESPADPFQEYDYDTEHWGIGIRGEALFGAAECAVGVRNLGYFAEFAIQQGSSFGVGATQSQDPICAWAMDAGLIYYCGGRTKPRVLVEYARASGDAGRRSPQNTAAGNLAGTTDHGFLGFGFLNTGVSFAPHFANLEFVRLAAACRPFEECCEWRTSDMEVGSSFFVYWRPEEDAGVSDIRADLPGDHLLGTEWDLFVNWRVSSDVYVLLNYGILWPHEDSFSVEKSRQFLALNLTWLF
jgi:hypothetical protein